VIILAYRCTRIACLFYSLSKNENTENQLIRFVIAYLLADNNVKRETVAATRDPRLQTYGLLTVLPLILWITGYVEYYSNVFIGLYVKTER